MPIRLALEADLSCAEFVDVLRRCSLGARRPLDDLSRIESMLRNADVVATAREENGELVGVARAITDFSYCCYLSDLAVAEGHQRQGLGKALIARIREAAGPQAKLILLAAPGAHGYYERLGMDLHPSAWTRA